jgi:hypothetical protein
VCRTNNHNVLALGFESILALWPEDFRSWIGSHFPEMALPDIPDLRKILWILDKSPRDSDAITTKRSTLLWFAAGPRIAHSLMIT